MNVENMPGFDELPDDEKSRILNISSILKEHNKPIDGPDVPDILELTNMIIAVFESLLQQGPAILDKISPDEITYVAKSIVALSYNMGKHRGEFEAKYQIERAVAQLEADLSGGSMDLAQMFNKAQSVRAQLQTYLDTLKEE